MRRLLMWNAITLDGYFEGEKGWDLSFHELVWGQEPERFSIEQLDSADMLVFGRTTYEGMANHWQNAEGEIAERMNRIPKAVCSRTLATADRNNTVIVRDAAAGVRGLKRRGDGNMFVFGSGILSFALMKEGLFDEYRLAIAPYSLERGGFCSARD